MNHYKPTFAYPLYFKVPQMIPMYRLSLRITLDQCFSDLMGRLLPKVWGGLLAHKKRSTEQWFEPPLGLRKNVSL